MKNLNVNKNLMYFKPGEMPVHYKKTVVGYVRSWELMDEEMKAEIRLTHCYKCGTKLHDCPGIGPFCPNKKCKVLDDVLGFNVKVIK